MARTNDGGRPAVERQPTDHARAAGGRRVTPAASRLDTPAASRLDTLLRRPAGQLLITTVTVLLFVGGAGLLAYPLLTDLYTDRVLQQRLGDEYARIDVATTDEWVTTVRDAGSPLTRIVIPSIDVSTLVVSGTSPAALRAGAGHYPGTPLPGEVGNVGIAGHRTTYGRPFERVDELRPGDEVWLLTPVGDHRYVVSDPDPDVGANPWITHPGDWEVVAPTEGAVLTLTSCHPKGSAAERIIVRAELVESVPQGSYLAAHGEPVA